jgi:hypothetical protein
LRCTGRRRRLAGMRSALSQIYPETQKEKKSVLIHSLIIFLLSDKIVTKPRWSAINHPRRNPVLRDLWSSAHQLIENANQRASWMGWSKVRTCKIENSHKIAISFDPWSELEPSSKHRL